MPLLMKALPVFLSFLLLFLSSPSSVLWAGYQGVWTDSSGKNYTSPPPSGGGTTTTTTSTPYILNRPSQAAIRAQHFEEDAAEAALDAGDNAYDAYERGDYATAIDYYEEALEYAPDDPDMQHNLNRARSALREAQAPRQIKSVDFHSQIASTLKGDAGSMVARKGFDTAGDDAGTLEIPPVRPGPQVSAGDPKVPLMKRTFAIAKMEIKREMIKHKIKKLKKEREKLDPVKDAVKIVEIKQEETKQKDQVHFLNFSITEELRKAPDKKSDSEKSDKEEKGK